MAETHSGNLPVLQTQRTQNWAARELGKGWLSVGNRWTAHSAEGNLEASNRWKQAPAGQAPRQKALPARCGWGATELSLALGESLGASESLL